MAELTAREYWQSQGTNFMTPDVVQYFTLTNGRLVELSRGTGFDREPIFGVSVALPSGRRDFDASQMFHSESDARRYIAEELQNG